MFLRKKQNERPAVYVALRALTEKRLKDALSVMSAVAETGHRRAQFHLGQLLCNGDCGRTDLAAGANWYRLSAEAGYPAAAYNLAALHALGKGVPQDWAEAARG